MRHAIRFCAMLVALLASTSGLAGQTTLALRGGASVATLGGSDVENADSRTGLSIGGAVTFGVSPNVGIQLGGAFVQKGATETEQGVDIKFSLDYVEVPLLLRVAVPTAGSISPHFMAGPAVSFEANCEVEGSAQGATVAVDCGASDIATKSIDFGAMVGAGLDIGVSGAASITLDVLYDIGLSSIDDSGDSDDVKNRAWSLLAGVAFPIG